MGNQPRYVFLDQTPSLLREGYRFLPNRRARYRADVFEIRVIGRRATVLVGSEAARLLYDPTRFHRAGVMPGPVRHTLVGDQGVQTLDGAAHQHRKAMFMNLLTPGRVEELGALVAAYWQEAIDAWPRSDEVVVFDEAARVLLRASADWAGLPLAAGEVPARARDMVSMVDGFASAGPRHWRARAARRRSEAWAAELVDRVRRGDLAVSPGSALGAVASHRDHRDAALPCHTAAVELLNLVRPTVAIAWYVTFALHAVQEHPEWRDRLRAGDDGMRERFMQEVRRYYPFAPALGARVRSEFEWHGHRFPVGRLVLLDVYGTHHDAREWPEPDTFDPSRFAGSVEPFALIPQGAGDPDLGHRCAGEQLTLRLAKESLGQLVMLDYAVPPQDLTIPLNRIPTRPHSGLVIRRVRRATTAGRS